MSKYIKLDDAIGIITEHQGIRGDTFKALHNAYAVDIVRCKECRKVREYGGHANCNGYLYCRKWKTPVDEGGFCSWGERGSE